MDVPGATDAIAAAARMIDASPDEVWCSGVLARGLAQAWPGARLHVVAVGRALPPPEAAGGAIHAYPLPFGREAKGKPPFPSDPHYDAKVWETATARHGTGRILFWNVTGPAIQT
jgi:hypothetical protein